MQTQSNSQCEVPAEFLQLLMEVGFVATGRGMAFKARDIFAGILAVRPNSEEAIIGSALSSFFLLGKLKEPSEMILRLLQKNPNNDLAKSFLALMFSIGKLTKQSESIAHEVIRNNKDQEAVNIAKGVLEEHKRNAA